MKKVLILLCLILCIALVSCENKKDVELKADELIEISFEPTEYYLFVHKADCKYCYKDYYYVNEYINNRRAKGNPYLYAYDLENNFLGLDVENVPALVYTNHKDNVCEVVAKGYTKVRNYLNKLNSD